MSRRFILAAGLSCLTACASVPRQTGVRIGDETLKQFKAGVTTESWVLAVLGPPRMDYQNTITAVSYIARLFDKVLNESE
jgi:transcriptional regulator of heat shock response